MSGIACGIDLVQDERIAAAVAEQGFVSRIYHPAERSHDARRMASIFAIKEAVFKALGIAPRWLDVEVQYLASGKPQVQVSKELLPGDHEIDCSVTHEAGLTCAMVVLRGR